MARYVSRFWKAIVVSLSVVLAFYLTILREDRNGLLVRLDSPTLAEARGDRPEPYDLAQLNIMNRVILLVKENYYEPERVDPKGMLLAGLDYVQRSVAEVLVEHAENAPTLKVRVDRAERTFRVDDVDSPWALSYRFKEIFRFIQENLRDEDVDLREVEYAAVNGMLHTLDPHSILLTPDIYEEMRLQTRGSFGGLGIVISIRDNQLTIISPIDGTPASRAGLRRMDRIVRINEESTINMRLDEAVNHLRGDPQTRVTVWIERRGWDEPHRFDLVREVIQVESILAKVMEGNVGYIRIKNFQGNTMDDLERALADMRRQNVRGLVLDLRNNPGGLLEQAVQISDAFLRSGNIVTTRGGTEAQEDKDAHDDGSEPEWPIVMLVNGGSASASEIVAGALQAHDRALVLGEQTFGKGSVQVLYDFDGGSALKLTIAEYLTPGGVSIQRSGITPDVAVAPMVVHGQSLDLVPTTAYLREGDLEGSLVSQSARAAGTASESIRYLDEFEDPEAEPDDAEADREDEFQMDFLIGLARDVLQRARASERREMLAEARSFLQERGAQEQTKADRELSRLGVDWSVGPDSGAANLDVRVSTGRPGDIVRAGDPFDLTATVTNRGPGTVYRLHGTTKSDNGWFGDREFAFGRVRPGETRVWKVPVKIRKDTLARIDHVELSFTEAHDHVPAAASARIRVEALPRPVFAWGVQMTDAGRGNGDGRIQRGELVTIHAAVKNAGPGPSHATTASLRNLSGEGVLLKAGRFEMNEMRPGETRRAAFTFEVSPDFRGDEVKVELSVADVDLREFVTEKLRFRIAEGARGPQAENFVGTARENTPVREEPSPDGRLAGTLAAGSIVRVTGRGGGFLRVEVADGRPGFVTEAAVAPGGAAPRPRFTEALQNVPPTIAIASGAEVSTRADHITLRGTATDDSRISDLYVFASHGQADRKVFYRSNRGGTEPARMPFETDVPLGLGSNMIVIVARENEDVMTRQILIVRRDNPDGTPAFTPQAHEEEGEE